MGFVNLDSSKSPASNLKKLMAGRVDLWLFDNVGVSDIARQQNADPAELELVLPFKSYQAYVAISRQTSEGIVRQWRSALQTMIDDGTFFEINHRWLPPESVPDLNAAKTYSDGAPTLKLYTEDSPPGSFSDNGKPAGFAVEIVREILKRRRHPDTIAIVPWSRGYTLAQSGPNVALFSTSRTEQRENRFHWVGPLYTQTWVLYGRKGADIRIRSLEDAKKIGRIGTYLRDAKGQYLQSMGFTNLVNTNRNSSNIRHLIEGNIDLWASSDFNMPYLARQAGFDPDDLEAVVPIRRVSNYIAFSLGTPLALVRDWQQCLDDIKMDGTYMRIARKYNYSIP
jgi:polar amino acid transport system substrate-binding protein